MIIDRFMIFSQLPARKLKIHVNPPIIFLSIAFGAIKCGGSRKPYVESLKSK